MYGNNFGYGFSGWQNGGGYAPQNSQSQNPQFGRYQNSQMQYDSIGPKPTLQVPWVNGEVGAQAYLIAPNSTALLMDSDNPIFYIKTSDSSGKAVIQAFKYEEIRPEMQGQSESPYVTKKEFEEFKASLLDNSKEEKI